MAKDKSTSITFGLPDGYDVTLITWEYVVKKFENIFSGIVTDISNENADLQLIDDKLSEWIDDDNGGNNNG